MQIQTIENVAHNIELQGQGLAPENNPYQTSANFLRDEMDYDIKQCMVTYEHMNIECFILYHDCIRKIPHPFMLRYTLS